MLAHLAACVNTTNLHNRVLSCAQSTCEAIPKLLWRFPSKIDAELGQLSVSSKHAGIYKQPCSITLGIEQLCRHGIRERMQQ